MGWKRFSNGTGRYKKRGQILYIWCSGSHGKSDWKKNFNLRTTMWLGNTVNAVDLEEAKGLLNELKEEGLLSETKTTLVYVAGFSRGGAVASIVIMMLRHFDVVGVLYAPKRSGITFADRGVPVDIIATKFDVVPFFPLRYPGYHRVQWYGPAKLPWKAHMKMAKQAAKWRHVVDKGFESWRKQ